MLTQIWSAPTDIIFCHFRLFFVFAPLLTLKIKISKKCKKIPGDIVLLHICTINQDHMHPWYDVCFLRYDVQQTELFCHLGPFFSLYPSNSPKNENFKTMKKRPGDIIILREGTKNHDQMLCSSWDIVCVGCNCYCSFWVIFSPFTPLTAQKMRTWKKHRQISFNTSVPKIMIICYTVPEIWCVMDVTAIFHLGYFLPFYPSNSLKKENFKTMKKININKKIKITPPKTTTTTTITWRFHHFTQVYQKSWSYAILFLRYMVCWRM